MMKEKTIMNKEIKDVAIFIKTDEQGNSVALLKPEYAVNGERILRTDAKSASAGKWITMNGAHVLIKRGKYSSGPFAGKLVNEPRFFSGKEGKVSTEDKETIISALESAYKDGECNLYMDNYKIELKYKLSYPDRSKDEVVVTAHNIIGSTGAGSARKMTVTKHTPTESGDRLVELHNLVKPSTMVIQDVRGSKAHLSYGKNMHSRIAKDYKREVKSINEKLKNLPAGHDEINKLKDTLRSKEESAKYHTKKAAEYKEKLRAALD